MKQWQDLIHRITTEGETATDRTGVGRRSIFGHQMRFDLTNEFPAVTTKTLHFRSVAAEILWFLRGDTNTSWLKQNGVTIWDEWADEYGELGPVYGAQWRAWPTASGGRIDQVQAVIDGIKQDPNGTRHIISAWNVGELHKMALPPCHVLYQFFCRGEELSCQVYQRSADVFLGVPFNIAGAALLTHLIAKKTKKTPRELVWTGGDCHLYSNHQRQAEIVTAREPLHPPTLGYFEDKPWLYYCPADFQLIGYKHRGRVPADVAV